MKNIINKKFVFFTYKLRTIHFKRHTNDPPRFSEHRSVNDAEIYAVRISYRLSIRGGKRQAHLE